MLRVAITGGPGSGKTTIAKMFAARGAHIIASDDVARKLMQPGEAVYAAIVTKFGNEVVREDKTLDRKKLAQLAFNEGRVKELEAIIHPAVIAAQSAWFESLLISDPQSIAIVESALVFESEYMEPKKRFDRTILVAAPESSKRTRFADRAIAAGAGADTRAALEADADRRLALQIGDADKLALCDFAVINGGDLATSEAQVNEIWKTLITEASASASN